MTQPITIAGRAVGPGRPTWIIAEIGIDHGGDEAVCRQMIAEAAAAGADAAKLQTITPEESYHPDTESYRVFSQARLPDGALARLDRHARSCGIVLFTTPGDRTALALVAAANLPAIKISSGLLTNHPLIAAAARLGAPLVMSTGMADLAEAQEAVAVARRNGAPGIAVLQCTSLYPAPPGTVNLTAMATLRRHCGTPCGYSDHHPGALACVAAVAAGADVIEKHFSVPGLPPGPDAPVALEAPAFAAMVRDIRAVEAMMGDGTKQADPREVDLRDGRRRRLVAARDLAAGSRLGDDDVFLMRLPAERDALPAHALDDVRGRRLARPVKRLDGIVADIFQAAKS